MYSILTWSTFGEQNIGPPMLTGLERRMLDCIRDHIQAHDISPTISEIAAQLNLKSRGTVHRYVQSLIEKKMLVREGTGWRGLRLANESADISSRADSDLAGSDLAGSDARALNRLLSDKLIKGSNVQLEEAVTRESDASQPSWEEREPDTELVLPLLGRIAAGLPIEAIPDESHLDLAAFFIGPDRYALRVTGDSMVDAGIMDGDTVILRNQNTARSGDIVVALIDDQEATLKRLGEYNDSVVELVPENSTMAPMRYSAERVSIQGVLIGQLRSY